MRAAQVIAYVGAGVLIGCARVAPAPPAGPPATSPPVGPGAATRADLLRWLRYGEPVAYHGYLQEMNVPSQHGLYVTWALNPAGPHTACEVDVRSCPTDADRCRGRHAVVEGTLLERGPRHLPLLVATRIQAEPRGTTIQVRKTEPAANQRG